MCFYPNDYSNLHHDNCNKHAYTHYCCFKIIQACCYPTSNYKDEDYCNEKENYEDKDCCRNSYHNKNRCCNNHKRNCCFNNFNW